MRFTTTLVVKVEPETAAALRRLAQQDDRSVSAVTRRLLAAALSSDHRPSQQGVARR